MDKYITKYINKWIIALLNDNYDYETMQTELQNY